MLITQLVSSLADCAAQLRAVAASLKRVANDASTTTAVDLQMPRLNQADKLLASHLTAPTDLRDVSRLLEVVKIELEVINDVLELRRRNVLRAR